MLLVVAWDGACFDLLDPWIENGRLPALAKLLQKGARRVLRSTRPAVTFPAWTTFMTAASPARHGLTDFTVRDGYRVRFVNASNRRLPTIWSLMSVAGLRVGVYGVPGTYPAERLCGIQVCGFDTPVGAGGAHRSTWPENLAVELGKRYGGLGVSGPQQARVDGGWHAYAMERMLGEIALRTTIAADFLASKTFDCFMVHYSESDTVSHQFWQLCDVGSPRYRGGRWPSSALYRVYRALDDSLGRLLAAAGEDAVVMLLSDHGSGGSSDRVVFWNRWLADHGWLSFHRSSAGGRLLRGLKKAALRGVPPALQSRLFRATPGISSLLESGVRFAGIDWSNTAVFSEELNYYPSFWLNLGGRDPQGTVSPGDAPAVLDRLSVELQQFRDPFDGAPVVRSVHRREDVFQGPYSGQCPDLVLDLREPGGYSYAAATSRGGRERTSMRRLSAAEMNGSRGTSMSGAHRATGMCVMAGPGVKPGWYPEAYLADAGASVLAMAGLAPACGMDGRVWSDLLGLGRLAEVEAGADQAGEPDPYSPAQEQEVAERLRALGYLP